MYYGEKFNSISHLIGPGLAVVGSALLIVLAAPATILPSCFK
jgi:hemolysin III